VHCDVWEGFIFVNLAKEPSQTLPEFLGPMILALDGYPFDKLTERWLYRAEIGSNWKVFLDAFQEFYHAPVMHANQAPPARSVPEQEAGFEAPYYEIDGPHRMVNTAGIRPWELSDEKRKPMEQISRSGLFGPWDAPDLGIEKMPPGVNPNGTDPWGLDSYQIWPNFVIIIWKQNWVLTYHYWPTAYNKHIFEGTAYFAPARTARERVAHEMTTLSFKEFGLQDANTCGATQSMVEARAFDSYPLSDQEVLCRHLHKMSRDAVESYRRERAGR
jgi:phenylpropionate dioxygenase-like ring-hydroxylating dioxygenase large terminal subunit